LSLGIYIVYSTLKNNIKPNLITKNQADKVQYSNRLIEFYDSENIEEIYKKYQEYVDFGISAKDAFIMLTEDKNI
jgi:hypothetical protein